MIKSICNECESQTNDGILKHTESCSANQPNIVTHYIRPPSVTIQFDTPEEQAEFLRNYTGGSANIKPNES